MVIHLQFAAVEYAASNGYKLRYRLYTPPLELGKHYPLILQLHGAGSWQDDNEAQLEQASRLIKPDFPAFIFAPKTVSPMKWVELDRGKSNHRQPETPQPSFFATHELLKKIILENSEIDSRRIYANGQSMGGYGAWDLITRWPEDFAAALLVCGGGDASKMGRLLRLSLWIIHGTLDSVVPPENSRSLVDALLHAGHLNFHYTEYPDVAHDAWVRAYDDMKVFQWLFAQKQ